MASLFLFKETQIYFTTKVSPSIWIVLWAREKEFESFSCLWTFSLFFLLLSRTYWVKNWSCSSRDNRFHECKEAEAFFRRISMSLLIHHGWWIHFGGNARLSHQQRNLHFGRRAATISFNQSNSTKEDSPCQIAECSRQILKHLPSVFFLFA